MKYLLTEDLLIDTKETRFLPIAKREITASEKADVLRKCKYPDTDFPDEVWATLGWKDNNPFLVGGHIAHSRNGQSDQASEIAEEEIELLKSIYPEINDFGERVLERYINLSELDIEIPNQIGLDSLHELRLDLFLKPDEGAVVFVQHSEAGNHKDKDAFIEYVSPQPTSADNALNNRYKLQFHIPITHHKGQKAVINDDGTDGPIVSLSFEPHKRKKEDEFFLNTDFIIKVLTFIRKSKSPEEALRNMGKSFVTGKGKDLLHNKFEALGQGRYALLKFIKGCTFCAGKNDDTEQEGGEYEGDYGFEDVSDGRNINLNARTLLLIHGTFKNTFGTFEHFIKSKYTNTSHNFLHYLLDQQIYDQILALDHPYFWDTPKQNAEWLFKHPFRHQAMQSGYTDVLAASRGGMVSMELATRDELSERLRIRKVLNFSTGASGYMQSIEGLSQMVSVMKVGAPTPLKKLLIGMVSIGLDYICKDSGMAILKPGNEYLQDIYTRNLKRPIHFKAMIADWNRFLLNRDDRIRQHLARAGASGLDALFSLFLGAKHDWVIGETEQTKLPTGNNAISGYQSRIFYSCMHGKYFEEGYPLKRAKRKRNAAAFNVYNEILEYLNT